MTTLDLETILSHHIHLQHSVHLLPQLGHCLRHRSEWKLKHTTHFKCTVRKCRFLWKVSTKFCGNFQNKKYLENAPAFSLVPRYLTLLRACYSALRVTLLTRKGVGAYSKYSVPLDFVDTFSSNVSGTDHNNWEEQFALELLGLAELGHPVETVQRVQPGLAVQGHVACHQPGLVHNTDNILYIY